MSSFALGGKVALGLVLAAVATAVLVQAPHSVIAGLGLIGVGAVGYEIGGMNGRGMRQRLGLAASVIIACLACYWLLRSSRAAINELMYLALAAWLLAAPLALSKIRLPGPTVAAMLCSFLLVCAWLALAVLAEYDRWMLIIGIVSVWTADTGAWLIGSRFGKVALAPKISPNKSWEGVYGALIGVLIVTSIFWPWHAASGIAPWIAMVVAAATTGLAVLGDLVASAFKRAAGVKDSSRLLASHGGVLDRIDSWLPVLPFYALLSTLGQ